MKNFFEASLLSIIIIFSGNAWGDDTSYYSGTINIRGEIVPAKAIFFRDYFQSEPKIEIQYELSGAEYLSTYIKDFGDKYIHQSDSIIVYNDSSWDKQNYYFQGNKISLIKYLF